MLDTNFYLCFSPTGMLNLLALKRFGELHCQAIGRMLLTWGPPKPRKAVLEAVLVLQMWPIART